MKKLIARLLFVISPALAFAMIAGAIFQSFGAGVVVAALMTGIGMEVTRPRPERGES